MKKMTMMSLDSVDPELVQLRASVLDAAEFLRDVDEDLRDGDQTARQVLSHLVFWHREYVHITSALAQGRKPRLRTGKYYEMNALADREFAEQSMLYLSKRLITLQRQLEQAACVLPDAEVKFSLKEGGSQRSLRDWSPQISAHIRSHTLRLQRALKRTMHSKHQSSYQPGQQS